MNTYAIIVLSVIILVMWVKMRNLQSQREFDKEVIDRMLQDLPQ